jgi:glycosyltransferase involved in cell wall biosynthesis
MPVLNEEKNIRKVLESIKVQPSNFEVLVIDNGCTDATIEIAKEYSFVKITKYTGNLGGAWQKGLLWAKGEYLIFIDADEYIPPKTFHRLEKLFLKKQSYHAIISKILPIVTSANIWSKYVHAYFIGDTMDTGSWKNQIFHSGGLAIQTKIAKKIGWNINMSVSADADFSYRFLLRGYQAFYNRDYIVFDLMYNDFISFCDYYKKLGLAGVIIFKKYPSIKILRSQVSALLEPFTTHYLITRYGKIQKLFTSFKDWFLIGVLKTLFMGLSWIYYGVLGRPTKKKILRYKT